MSAEFEQGGYLQTMNGRLQKRKKFNSATKILKRRTILSLRLSVKALKLPFTKTQKAELKNNASTLSSNVFADSPIKELLGT